MSDFSMYRRIGSNSGSKLKAVPSVAVVSGPSKFTHSSGWKSRSPLTSMAMQSSSGQSGELPGCLTTGVGTADSRSSATVAGP